MFFFRMLPKIHKDGIPGRPTVSSCGAPTERISSQSIGQKSTIYTKDTTDLLKSKLVGKVPPGSLLITLDVRSLYTNIPHAEGIEACRELLNTRVIQEPPSEIF